MRLNITIVVSGVLFIVILVSCFSSLKIENGLKTHDWNVAETNRKTRICFLYLQQLFYSNIQTSVSLKN